GCGAPGARRSGSVPRLRHRLALGYELEGEPVVAPPLPGRLGAVVEYVPLVPAAAGAVVLGARPDQLEVALGVHVPLDRADEAGPAGPALELVVGAEEGEVAGRADECPGALLLVQLAGARRLRRLLEQHLVALLREDLPPLLLRPVDPGDLG